MNRYASAGYALADTSGRQKVRFQFDRRKRSTVRDVIAASDGGTCVGESDDSGSKEESGTRNEVLGDVDMPDHQIRAGVVEDTAKLTGYEWTEELCRPTCSFDWIGII
jgi:hypothetical protein